MEVDKMFKIQYKNVINFIFFFMIFLFNITFLISEEYSKKVNFSTQLLNEDNTVVTGKVNIQTKIYDSETGGSALKTENFNDVELDSKGYFYISLDFTGVNLYQQTWLDLTVNNDHFSSRIPIRSSAKSLYSYESKNAEKLAGEDSDYYLNYLNFINTPNLNLYIKKSELNVTQDTINAINNMTNYVLKSDVINATETLKGEIDTLDLKIDTTKTNLEEKIDQIQASTSSIAEQINTEISSKLTNIELSTTTLNFNLLKLSNEVKDSTNTLSNNINLKIYNLGLSTATLRFDISNLENNLNAKVLEIANSTDTLKQEISEEFLTKSSATLTYATKEDLENKTYYKEWIEIGTSGAPNFQNSWINYGNGYTRGAFMKDNNGFIHLRGAVKPNGTMNSVIFNLPDGYRPSAKIVYMRMIQDITRDEYSFGKIIISSDGKVTMESDENINGFINLEDIYFL
jgi:hypothetical protein